MSALALELTARAAFVVQHGAGLFSRRALEAPEEGWVRYDPLLGWSNRPSVTLRRVTINAGGWRGLEPHAQPKPPGLRRVAIVGDSFTFGPETADGEDYPARLARRLGRGFEVVNAAVVAYGVDQMLLRLRRDVLPLSPDLVVFAAIPDDFHRVDLEIWPTGYGRPRFRLKDGRLVEPRVPVPGRVPVGRRLSEQAIGQALGWRPLLPRMLAELRLRERKARDGRNAERREASELHKALLLAARDETLRAGARFLFVLIPRDEHLDAPPRLRESVLAFCREQGIEVLDLFPAFAALPRGMLRDHPNGDGNRVIAWAIHDKLARSALVGAVRAPRASSARRELAGPDELPSPAARAPARVAAPRMLEGAPRRASPVPAPARIAGPKIPPRPKPATFDSLIERARAALRRGEDESFESLLASAEALRREDSQRLLLARLRRELALKRNDAPSWLKHARAALAAGLSDDARRSLELQEALAPGPQQRRAAALLWQELGEWGKALTLLQGLPREGREGAAVLADEAVCQGALGRTAEAAASLEQALRADPELDSALLSLGALREREGRAEEALGLYERGARSSGGHPRLRAAAESERARLAAALAGAASAEPPR